MRGIKQILILLVVISSGAARSQNLSKLCPITLKAGIGPDSISFVLTTLDDNVYKRKPLHYAPGIEIIDADAPWPPRWYASHSSDTSDVLERIIPPMLNATYDNDQFHFLTAVRSGGASRMAVVNCNKALQPVDTFAPHHHEMDPHDFVTTGDGSVLYFAKHDTAITIANPNSVAGYELTTLTYQTIEIADRSGRSIFSWDPLIHLGYDAIYMSYRYAQGVMAGKADFDWSHGNALHYDTDGDILYSYRNIGIGKISRRDGHVIWHIDRNRQRINTSSDSIPIFLQHDLQSVTDESGHTSYTIWSNGDSVHPYGRAYQFTVTTNSKAETIVKLIKTITPSEPVPNTGGGGNIDMDKDGSYLLNYAIFDQDISLHSRTMFEYHYAKSTKPLLYETSPSIFSFRVHRLHGWRPERPVIAQKGNSLSANINSKPLRWYQLSGTDLKTVTYLGEYEEYTPAQDGYYCVASRLGIGWSVSKAFHYTAKK